MPPFLIYFRIPFHGLNASGNRINELNTFAELWWELSSCEIVQDLLRGPLLSRGDVEREPCPHCRPLRSPTRIPFSHLLFHMLR